jgi:hypothetical protein
MALINLTNLAEWGTFEMSPQGPFTAGVRTAIRFIYTVGPNRLPNYSRLRIGVPNTGWERPVVPQQRYWDELIQGHDRRLAPFHPVNTTAIIRSERKPGHALEVMERMLLPDEDPALAYWRWWITLTLEGADLEPGDQIEILYGDSHFGIDGVRVQAFVEPSINVTAYLDPGGKGGFFALPGTPLFLDVVSGPATRANLVLPSVRFQKAWTAKIALTDECHCIPVPAESLTLLVGGVAAECRVGEHSVVTVSDGKTEPVRVQAVAKDGSVWGRSNPSVPAGPDGLQLFWGDLHAQSEHHVMHSQRKDFRQEGWSKGISCGTLDECYHYGREVSLLDFVAITDQGACLTKQWEYCQQKVREHHRPGEFVVFKGYEAGAPSGHRNVIYLSDEIDPPLDAALLHNFHPPTVFTYYRDRADVLIIPHHVKTWTNWLYYDPVLEPIMEVYSCWGQSESPGTDLWNKGQTLGAGAWEAFQRGYKLGMIASSDNHVGMPGRSYPGDRQIHTPFKGGLCAVWATDLSRESLFEALRQRRCYGTTGERILLRFSIDAKPMGTILAPSGENRQISLEVHGTDALDRIELVHDLKVSEVLRPHRDEASFIHTAPLTAGQTGCYYIRVYQKDGERAWSSPIWVSSQ